MAEQRVSLPVTPKLTKSHSGNARRHSTGKATSIRSDEKIQPHHIRASTGSCHDFCKFGTKHEFEGKTRHPFLRKNSRKLGGMDTQNSTSKFTTKPSSNSKTPLDTLKFIKQEVPRKPVGRKSPALNVVVTEPADSRNSVSSKKWSERRKTTLPERDKTLVADLKNSPDSKSRLSTKFMNHGVSSSEKLGVSLKQASLKLKDEKIPSKSGNSLKVNSSSQDSSEVSTVQGNIDRMISQKRSTSKTTIKRVETSQKAFLPPKISGSGIARAVTSPRASVSLKPTVRVQMSARASLFRKPSFSRLGSLNATRNTGSDVVAQLQNQSKIKEANNNHPEIESSNPDLSIKELKEPESNAIQEKTLYVIKMDTENKYLESDGNENIFMESPPSPPPPPSPLPSRRSSSVPESPLLSSNQEEEDEEKSEFTASDTEDDCSEYDEIECLEEPDTVEKVQKGWHRKAGMTSSQDETDQPVKLRFRRGKVIDIKPEHNGPRRLKFRQGRVLADDQIVKVDARKRFKRREAAEITNDNHKNPEKVVLRHQDICEKKDDKILLNNVIEETANKLVETRKSKVKALVGAFETVISLQDSKSPIKSLVS